MIPHFERLEESLEDIHDKFKKFGVDLSRMRHLGSGMMGHVFDIGNKRVAKFTSDYLEAKTAAHLRDVGPLEHTWQVHHAIEMSSDEAKELQRVFPHHQVPDYKEVNGSIGTDKILLKNDKGQAIHTGEKVGRQEPKSHNWVVIGEKLHPLSGVERRIHNDADAELEGALDVNDFYHKSHQVADFEPSDFVKTFQARWNKPPSSHHRFIYNAMRELSRNKVGFSDTHGGNIMKTATGKPKFVDIGVSEGPEEAQLDRLGGGPYEPEAMRKLHKKMGGKRLQRYANVKTTGDTNRDARQGLVAAFVHKLLR